jgi:hypothetical protein
MGRRSHKRDPARRRQVEALAACGIPEPDIAAFRAADQVRPRPSGFEKDVGRFQGPVA